MSRQQNRQTSSWQKDGLGQSKLQISFYLKKKKKTLCCGDFLVGLQLWLRGAQVQAETWGSRLGGEHSYGQSWEVRNGGLREPSPTSSVTLSISVGPGAWFTSVGPGGLSEGVLVPPHLPSQQPLCFPSIPLSSSTWSFSLLDQKYPHFLSAHHSLQCEKGFYLAFETTLWCRNVCVSAQLLSRDNSLQPEGL